MHTDKRLFRWHNSRVTVANAYLLSLFLLAGCATTQSKLTAEDKSQLGRIGITKAYEKPTVTFGGVPNAASGVAQGVVGGLLFPPAWTAGGPFFFGPLLAVESARCGAQFDNVKNPDQQFEVVVNATRPDEFLLKYLADRIEGAGLGKPAILETPLKRLDGGKFSVTSIADQSIDTVLQIEQFKIGLEAVYVNNSQNIRPCSPQVTGDIVWHLIRVRDGKQIASGTDQWNVNSSYRFSALYQDAALMRSILNELLEKVANGTMCKSGADSNRCPWAIHVSKQSDVAKQSAKPSLEEKLAQAREYVGKTLWYLPNPSAGPRLRFYETIPTSSYSEDPKVLFRPRTITSFVVTGVIMPPPLIYPAGEDEYLLEIEFPDGKVGYVNVVGSYGIIQNLYRGDLDSFKEYVSNEPADEILARASALREDAAREERLAKERAERENFEARKNAEKENATKVK